MLRSRDQVGLQTWWDIQGESQLNIYHPPPPNLHDNQEKLLLCNNVIGPEDSTFGFLEGVLTQVESTLEAK